MPGAEGTAGANVEGQIQSGPNGNRSIRHCNPQTGRVSPADSRPTSEVAAQKTAAKILDRTLRPPPPRPLIEDLRDTHILYIYREDRDYADAAHCETSTLMKLL